MHGLAGKVAWVTGAGSGIGEAAALALAGEGAAVVLSGRRREPLDAVAARVRQAGGRAHVEPGDLMDAAVVKAIGHAIASTFGRLDILINNAGLNILARSWAALTPEGAALLINGNLTTAYHCVTVALPLMRAQRDGLLIHTSSMAGRTPSAMSGTGYSAAKHGVVAMSHSINMEECQNGIRSCVILPGEVATPILDQRPNPVSAEDRARMLTSEDVAAMIRTVALLPGRICVNEIQITPTWNRGYIAAQQRRL